MKKYRAGIFAIVGLILLVASCKKDTYGCTYPNSENYSNKATIDDGSCIPKQKKALLYSTEIYADISTTSYTIKPDFITEKFETGDELICEYEIANSMDTSFWRNFPYISPQGRLDCVVTNSGNLRFEKRNFLGSTGLPNFILFRLRITLLKAIK